MTIRMILDSSAVAAYVSGSIHVGELLSELHDERPDVRFAVPVVCLADAGIATEQDELLFVLAAHERGVVAPTSTDRWRELLAMTKMVGNVLHAVPYLEVLTTDDCYLVTATPHAYPPTDLVIDVGY